MTELLSVYGLLTRQGLIIAWLVVVASLVVVVARRHRGAWRPGPFPPYRLRLSAFRALFLVQYVFVLTLAIVAVVAPPNTWDSMTYHMSRVMHWIQNRSVGHYPTNIPRQLELSPGAEFIILHLQLLTGSDRFANLPQWLAMIGCLFGTSIIAGRMGAGPAGRVLTAVICLTIPMGILQSTSTQNDYVFAFWLTCATWAVLELAQSDASRIPHWSALFGAAFGLALLTKTMGFLYGPPLLVWFLWTLLKRGARRSWRSALVAASLVLCLNAGFFLRNYQIFGSPLGERGLARLVSNSTFGPQTLVSNLIRNAAIHANLPIPGAIDATTALVRALHSSFGVDPDDPATTYPGVNFHVNGPFHFEDVAGCGVHLVLILASVVFCVGFRPARQSHLLAYAAVWTTGFILFCLYLKWQPWHSRLHLPLFVLFSPFVGVTVPLFLSRKMIYGLASTLLFLALPYLVFNQSRPIVQLRPFLGPRNLFTLSRRELIFVNRPHLQGRYEAVAREIVARDCARVGLFMGLDDWEYPMWFLLQEMSKQERVIGHVGVTNASSILGRRPPFSVFDPGVTLVWDGGAPRLDRP